MAMMKTRIFPSLNHTTEQQAQHAQMMAMLYSNDASRYWTSVQRSSTGSQRKKHTNRLHASRKAKHKHR